MGTTEGGPPTSTMTVDMTTTTEGSRPLFILLAHGTKMIELAVVLSPQSTFITYPSVGRKCDLHVASMVQFDYGQSLLAPCDGRSI